MDQLLQAPLTMTVVKAGLTAGTTTTYSTTANPVLYCIRGKAYTKATVTNGATPTTDANSGLAFKAQAIGTGSVYVFGYDSADRKSTRLNSSHIQKSRMPSSA